jgi:hypothetical protein
MTPQTKLPVFGASCGFQGVHGIVVDVETRDAGLGTYTCAGVRLRMGRLGFPELY